MRIYYDLRSLKVKKERSGYTVAGLWFKKKSDARKHCNALIKQEKTERGYRKGY